ncbi:MAG: hypothetical protein LBP56_07620 [Odoribacteraceae bacterium]|jgi:hypothetical protein|nr:hypothetical protein [Odoribacteraceae bacterium]
MKNKFLFALSGFLFSLLVNCLAGAAVGLALGAPPALGAAVAGGVSLATGPWLAPGGAARAGLLAEVWTGFMTKAFRDEAGRLGWYEKIRSFDQHVNADVIHFVNVGGDPSVLVNNSTYPLAVETLADANKAITLDLYETKATAVTDNELNALSYDKIKSVIERHKEALDAKKHAKALHALAPGTDEAGTPVLVSTGAEVDGRLALTRGDLIALKKKFDALKVPLSGRVLVLCPDHVSDLLHGDQKFAEQYYNYATGKVFNLYGFEVHEYTEPPHYTVATRAKAAFGTVPTAAMTQGSVAFHASRVMKANGTLKAYASRAADDPLYHRNLLNFSLRSICLPLKDEALGAIISGLPAGS